MKKLILAFILVVSSLIITSQVPEKKKDSAAPIRGQERAINEVGMSVKSKPSKISNSNSPIPTSTKEEKKKMEQNTTDAKNPE